MPIKPENRDRYPANWGEIRAAILERAGDKCEFCGLANRLHGWRVPSGAFYTVDQIAGAYIPPDDEAALEDMLEAKPNGMRIVLTIAHLDHTPENNDPANLRALCQRCHLRYDAQEHGKNAAATRKANRLAGQTSLFDGDGS
jgi:5-methylcytosine-specific restriction endonuclease McrA